MRHTKVAMTTNDTIRLRVPGLAEPVTVRLTWLYVGQVARRAGLAIEAPDGVRVEEGVEGGRRPCEPSTRT